MFGEHTKREGSKACLEEILQQVCTLEVVSDLYEWQRFLQSKRQEEDRHYVESSFSVSSVCMAERNFRICLSSAAFCLMSKSWLHVKYVEAQAMLSARRRLAKNTATFAEECSTIRNIVKNLPSDLGVETKLQKKRPLWRRKTV